MALGALSLLACAVPLDREVVVFVFGFASVRCRHSLRPCPSVPVVCLCVWVWSLGWLFRAVIWVAWLVLVQRRQWPGLWVSGLLDRGERPRRDPVAAAMHACATCVSLRKRVRSA